MFKVFFFFRFFFLIYLVNIRIWGIDYLQWKLLTGWHFSEFCLNRLGFLDRSLHLFHSQNSHRSSHSSNFISLKVREWLCFQVCPKILLWSTKLLYDKNEGGIKGLLHLFLELIHLPLHVTLCVCLCCAEQKYSKDECVLAIERGIVWKPHVAYIYKNDDKNGNRHKKRFCFFF